MVGILHEIVFFLEWSKQMGKKKYSIYHVSLIPEQYIFNILYIFNLCNEWSRTDGATNHKMITWNHVLHEIKTIELIKYTRHNFRRNDECTYLIMFSTLKFKPFFKFVTLIY